MREVRPEEVRSAVQSEGFAVVSWLSDDGHCDLPAMVGDLIFAQSLLVGATQSCSAAMAQPWPAG